jgi:hypothetical protein
MAWKELQKIVSMLNWKKARAIKKQIMMDFLLSHADLGFAVVIPVLAAPLNSPIVSTADVLQREWRVKGCRI